MIPLTDTQTNAVRDIERQLYSLERLRKHERLHSRLRALDRQIRRCPYCDQYTMPGSKHQHRR